MGGSGIHALLFIDLDQLKLVNDACGPRVGYRLYTEVLIRLRGERGKLTMPSTKLDDAAAFIGKL